MFSIAVGLGIGVAYLLGSTDNSKWVDCPVCFLLIVAIHYTHHFG